MLYTNKGLGLRLALLLVAATLGGCLDSVPTETLPATVQTRSLYTGPAPATADVQAFMTNVWTPLSANNRCGACHIEGGQSPMFARTDDVNLAYSDAITVVTLTQPADSRLVTKVSGGHNCWLESDSACGAVISAYIQAWATGAGVASSGNIIELTAPPIKDPGTSLVFPDDSADFAATVHPLLTAHCAGCHRQSSATPQAPFFAEADAVTAYEAVVSAHKIDLDTPNNSRLVVRLRDEFHNCWDDCGDDADEMRDAIAAFAGGLVAAQVDPDWVTSKALNLTDGIIASGGSRYEANLVALYEFKEGTGNVAYDTSGVEPAMHLTLSGTENVDFQWVGGWGMEFLGGKAQATTAASAKLAQFIQASGEYSVEAWVVPANVTQEGPARIISYSGGTDARNFTLGQTQYNYDFLQRMSTTDENGEPALSTADADEDLQATQQHVVVTYDAVNGRRIYVNGVDTGDRDTEAAGNFADWDDSFAFVLGNEVSNNRPWRGKLRLVAIHNRALTPEQVQQNFDVGVGEKYFLLFSVSDLIGLPDSYIMFEVSQFDSYSYLFNRPTFINLDPTVEPSTIALSALRIGINGKEAGVGQAFRHLDTTINAANYEPGTGQLLSTLGTIIATELGADNDEFFLTFETLGSNTNARTESVTLTTAAAADLDPASAIGLRTFDEINATMSQLTGVATTHSDVSTTFDTIKQQLPTVENIETFLSSHQVGVSQLAIEYCNALVEDTALRASFFPGVNFGAAANTAFDTVGERDAVIDPLVDTFMGTGLSSQPARADVKTEISSLVTSLSSCGGSCAADRTETVVKAACSAVLGSAVMLIQ